MRVGDTGAALRGNAIEQQIRGGLSSMVVGSTTGVYVKPDSVLARTAREMVEAHFGGSGPRDGVTVCPTCGDPLPCAAGRAAAEVLAAAGLAQTARASGLVQAARQGLPMGAGAPSPLGQTPVAQAHVGSGPVGQPPLGQSAPDRPHEGPGQSEDAASGRRPEPGAADDRSPFVRPQADRPHATQPPPAPPVPPGRRSRTVGDQAIGRPGPEQPSLGRPFETTAPVEPVGGPPPFGRSDEGPQEQSGPAAPPTFKGWAEINQETAAESGHPSLPSAGPPASPGRDGHRQSGPGADQPSAQPGQFGRPGAFGRDDESGQFAQPHPVPQGYPAQQHHGGQPEHTPPAALPDRRPFGGQPFTLDDPQHGAPAPDGRPATAPAGPNGYRPHGSTPAGGAPGRDVGPHAAAPDAAGPSGLTLAPPSWTPGGGIPASDEGADSPPSGLPQRPDGDGLPPSRGASPAA